MLTISYNHISLYICGNELPKQCAAKSKHKYNDVNYYKERRLWTLKCFQILNNEVLIENDEYEYKDTPENFVLDGGSLEEFAVSKAGGQTNFVKPERVIYDNVQKHCLVNGELYEYPNTTLDSYIDKIFDYIAAKEEREYVEPEPPTQEELNEAEANKTKATLRNLAVSAMMMSLAGSPVTSQAEEYKTVIKGVSDDVALLIPEVYPVWSGNSVEYKKDMRVTYNSILYKVLQNHTSQKGWTPTSAPSLFAKVLTSEGEILDWEQPDSTNPYMKGDKVKFKGKIYESVIDNNVWSPEAYPQGWKEVEE